MGLEVSKKTSTPGFKELDLVYICSTLIPLKLLNFLFVIAWRCVYQGALFGNNFLPPCTS